jgi:hypothetical protein
MQYKLALTLLADQVICMQNKKCLPITTRRQLRVRAFKVGKSVMSSVLYAVECIHTCLSTAVKNVRYYVPAIHNVNGFVGDR